MNTLDPAYFHCLKRYVITTSDGEDSGKVKLLPFLFFSVTWTLKTVLC